MGVVWGGWLCAVLYLSRGGGNFVVVEIGVSSSRPGAGCFVNPFGCFLFIDRGVRFVNHCRHFCGDHYHSGRDFAVAGHHGEMLLMEALHASCL